MSRAAKNAIGFLLIATSGLILLSINIFANLDAGETPDATAVPSGVPGHALVCLLDVTDPYRADQVAGLVRNIRERELGDIETGDVVSVWALGRFPEGDLVQIF